MKTTYLFLLLSTFSFSQDIENGWSTYNGKIGNSSIIVSLFKDAKNNLIGNYCYNKYEKRIPLKGILGKDSFTISEYSNSKATATFYGLFVTNDSITGKWKNNSNNNIFDFTMQLSAWTGGSIDHKYSSLGSNKEIENYFEKTKKAIIDDDKIWLSTNISYPIKVTINNKKVTIKSSKDFITKYTSIITQAFKTKISNHCICDIFANDQGAMIANGALWINKIKSKLVIISINN